MDKLKNKNQNQSSEVTNIKKPRKISSAKLIVLFFVLAVFLLPVVVTLAVNSGAADGYDLYPNISKQIFTGSGDCRQVKNNSGVAYFIPTRTTAEWQSFENAKARLGVDALSTCSCSDAVDCLPGLNCGSLSARCIKTGADNPACAGYVDRASCQNANCLWSVTTVGSCYGGACVPNCGGKNCGADACGGLCGTCGSMQECSVSGVCTSTCGNGSCQATYSEDCSTCPTDCGSCGGGTECYDDSYCPPGQYCAGLIAYCQGDWYCGDYTNMSDCGYNGCDWALQQSGTCSY